MNEIDLFYKNLIAEARDFAILKHGNQKYGEHDYIYHLDNVYKTAIEFNLDFKYLIAAYLHDTIEDTETTKEEVEIKFGSWMASAVYTVSGFGEGRKARKLDVLSKLAIFEEAIDLKMIDRLSNMREALKNKDVKLFKMYVNELDDYNELFLKGNKDIYYELQMFKFDPILKDKKKLNI